ncbi:acrB/AcrD/AcrF family protein, partial [Vibrio parahaemolyticus V-223/04]
QT